MLNLFLEINPILSNQAYQISVLVLFTISAFSGIQVECHRKYNTFINQSMTNLPYLKECFTQLHSKVFTRAHTS